MSTETASSPPKPVATGAADGDADAFRFGRPPTDLPHLHPAPDTRLSGSPGVEIVDLDLTQSSARARFLDMADPIYEGDPNYISLLRMQFMKFLNPSKNPAFRNYDYRALLAMQGDRPVARMIVHIDRAYIAYHGSQTGFFGFFESINDRAVAHTLLGEACRWLSEKGMVEVFGPVNFSTNHQVGLLVENFERPPFVDSPYNPPFYQELFSSFGFGKAKDLLIFLIDVSSGMDTPRRKRIQKMADRVRQRESVSVRPANFKEADKEIRRMHEVYVKAWEKNWGFVPPDDEEFHFLMSDLKTAARPELILFIEYKGQPVGFSATLPNVNEKLPKNGRLFPFNWLKLLNLTQTKTGRLVALGMRPEYRKRGLETILFAETLKEGQRLGWSRGEIGWTLEDNELVNRAIESMEGRLDRRYRILGLKLDGEA